MEESLLEKLAADFCSDFIKVLNNPENRGMKRLIGLYGADEETLICLRNRMQRYFQEKEQEVEIVLANQIYGINVGYYIKKSSPNTVPQSA